MAQQVFTNVGPLDLWEMMRRAKLRHIRAASLAVLLLVLSVDAFSQWSSSYKKDRAENVKYIPLSALEFPTKARSLLNKDVEVSGDIQTPQMISQNSAGTLIDPHTGKSTVSLIISDRNSYALVWLAGRNCKTRCPGVFARGRITMISGRSEPVLDLIDVSFESKVQAESNIQATLATLTNKDSVGKAKPVLPPHTIPTKYDWKPWLERAPRSAPSPDKSKSVLDNMKKHSEYKQQAAADDARAMIRGPERPADFQTYYRGLRDTGLSLLFDAFPYQDASTIWPRVMITVEERPQTAGMPNEYFEHSKTETDYCWRFRAKVWFDAEHSVDIAPFNWCFSEMRFNTPYNEVPIWGRTPKTNMILAKASTGRKRTTGPTPPSTPLPDTPEYQRMFSYTTIMIGNILLDMGFEVFHSDGRVWFLEDLAK
jgi:hypothetical protein